MREDTIETGRIPGAVSRLIPVGFFLFVSLALAAPLFLPGMFDSHEGDAYLLRLYGYDTAVRDGFVSGRWFRDFVGGAGYPFLSFYPPLFFYLAEFLHLSGLGIVASVKLVVFLGLFASGFFAYLLIRRMDGSMPVALGGGFLYLYLPYHLVNLYVRGDLSEFTAMAMVPVCFIAMIELSRAPERWVRRFALAAAFAAITLTHTLTALAISPMLLALAAAMMFSHPQKKAFSLGVLGGLAGGILLTIYHWLPAFVELKYVQHEILTSGYYRFEDHFLSIRQLLTGRWGYGGSRAGLDDEMDFEVGAGNFIAAGLLALFLARNIARKRFPLLPGYIFAMMTLSVLLTLPLSKALYTYLPLMKFVQFPWRMFLFAGFFSSLAVVSLDDILRGPRARWVLVGALMILEIGLYARQYQPREMFPVNESMYPAHFQNHRNVITTNAGEFFTRWTRDLTVIPEGDVVWIRGGPLQVKYAEKKTGRYRFLLETKGPTQVVLNCLWFPGWEARVNGEPQVIGPESVYFDETGLIQVVIPPGLSEVELTLRLTPVRRYSLVLTFFTLVLLIIAVVGEHIRCFRKKRWNGFPPEGDR